MNILYEDTALVVLDKPAGLTSEEAGSARHEGVIATAPAGVACLMVSLCLRLLLRPDAGDSALFHADLSVPELERFEF